MKFNFKKISAVTSSLIMAGMAIATPVAAANYPAPFVSGSTASGAIVYGTGAGVSNLDVVQASNIQSDLQSSSVGTDSSVDTTVSGEAYALYTSSSRIYMNESINSVKASLTDSQLPTVLADGTFDGDVTADVTQRIELNGHPRVVFGQHPTSDDDPTVAIATSTTASNHIYNVSISFNKAVNLTHTDSIGTKISMLGKDYTIGAGTDKTNLYMYQSSETVSLSIGGSSPSSSSVDIDGETYTVELIAATDSAATIKVTDSTGASQSKEIDEDDSKKVQGIDIAVDTADEDTATNRLLADITIGANKLKLVDGSEVMIGSDEDIIEGTKVIIDANTEWQNTTGFKIQAFAADTDEDAIVQGGSFVDPVFESFKLDFVGLANDADREVIEVKNSGNDKATVKFTTHTGDESTVTFYYNESGTAKLGDDSGYVINTHEGQQINESEFVVVGNEENGYLLELTNIYNKSDSHSDDYVQFKDVFSGKTYKSDSASAEGTATLSVEGEDYTVTYVDNRDVEGDEYVTLDYPDSAAGYVVVYPTIETSLGANIAFYEPLTIELDNYDGAGTDATYLSLPDGDGFTDLQVQGLGIKGNFTIDGTEVNNTGTSCATKNIGRFTYNFTSTAANTTTIYLQKEATGNIALPGLMLFEEQDDSANTYYHGLIVIMEGGGNSADGVGVSDIETTWGVDTQWDEKQLESDTDIYQSMDYWGTLITSDRSESDQYTAEISYPDQQVYAEVYAAEDSASITTSSGSGTGSLGDFVLVKDSEIDSVKDKNLVIVGGSCINSAAATVLGGGYCGASFTEQTSVGSGQFLIQGVEGAYTSGKIALLVAGYEAADTVNAATYLVNQPEGAIDTSKKYVGTSSTSAELVTEETSTEESTE